MLQASGKSAGLLTRHTYCYIHMTELGLLGCLSQLFLSIRFSSQRRDHTFLHFWQDLGRWPVATCFCQTRPRFAAMGWLRSEGIGILNVHHASGGGTCSIMKMTPWQNKIMLKTDEIGGSGASYFLESLCCVRRLVASGSLGLSSWSNASGTPQRNRSCKGKVVPCRSAVVVS